MKISKKILVPLLLLIIAAAAGGGYYLWQGKAPTGKDEKAAQRATQYTCPMHPFIIKDKPGACPICGMTLVPVKKGGEEQKGETAAGLEEVSLSPTQMVMANVETVTAEKVPITREIDAVGMVQYDQARQSKVTAWVAGRIDRLFVEKVGDYVSAGRPVALLYSPDLVSAQQEYLLALKSRDRLKNSPVESISQGGEGLVSSARERLRLLGVKERQIADLEKAGEPNIRLSVYTPLSGVVIDKMVQQGQYVNVGDILFNIADLSTVWVELEIYESDFPLIKIGQKVDIVSQSYPDRTFTGRVAYVYPFLDPKSRTVKVRVVLHNPGMRLKPDMFVNAAVKVPMGNFVAVPVNAVLDTGKRKVVWVESGNGRYEQRDVKVGVRSGEIWQILSGLSVGEKVAASGGYLIDSEAQLRGGGGSMPGMKMEEKGKAEPAPAGQGGQAAPAAPKKKDEMNMDDMNM